VHDVAEGGEDRLRHFLEGAVLQANAADEREKREAREEDQDAQEDEADPLDAEMTERFRSFGAELRD
jgi:hypothetical protein